MSLPKVSVIIPTRNRAKLLVRTIKSVLAQDYENIELIVVDDASEDETRLEVAKFPEVRYLRLVSRGGQAHARNVGMDYATGEFIRPMDSDDELPAGTIKSQVRYLMDNDDVEVVFGYIQVYRHGKPSHFNKYRPVTWNVQTTLSKNLNLPFCEGNALSTLLSPDLSKIGTCNGNCTYRANSLRQDPRIDWPRGAGADQHFWVRLGMYGCRFHYLDEPSLIYHIHDSNLWADAVKIRSKRYRQVVKTRLFALALLRKEHQNLCLNEKLK